MIVADNPAWTRIRVREIFAGGTSSREAFRMGGTNGNAFEGRSRRCDNDAMNFWQPDRGFDPRSVVVVLRRVAGSTRAGSGA